MKCIVRKIKPNDPGYGSEEAMLWPWLVERSGSGRGRAFPTHKQALYYATTGNRLRLSFEERSRIREQQGPYWARVKRDRGATSSSR